MSIFKNKTSDRKYDDLISAETKSIKKSDRVMSAMDRKLKKERKEDRKKTVIGLIHRVASKPISQKDGMEMMFGTKTFKQTNRPDGIKKFTGFGR